MLERSVNIRNKKLNAVQEKIKQKNSFNRSIILNDFLDSFDETVAISEILLTYDNDYIVTDMNKELIKTLMIKQHELCNLYNAMNDEIGREIPKINSVISRRDRRK